MEYIRKAKDDYYKNLINNLNDPTTCSKKWWNLVKTVYGDKQKSNIPDLNVDGTIIDDLEDKCNKINDFFVQQTYLDESDAVVPDVEDSAIEFHMPQILAGDVSKILQALNS